MFSNSSFPVGCDFCEKTLQFYVTRTRTMCSSFTTIFLNKPLKLAIEQKWSWEEHFSACSLYRHQAIWTCRLMSGVTSWNIWRCLHQFVSWKTKRQSRVLWGLFEFPIIHNVSSVKLIHSWARELQTDLRNLGLNPLTKRVSFSCHSRVHRMILWDKSLVADLQELVDANHSLLLYASGYTKSKNGAKCKLVSQPVSVKSFHPFVLIHTWESASFCCERGLSSRVAVSQKSRHQVWTEKLVSIVFDCWNHGLCSGNCSRVDLSSLHQYSQPLLWVIVTLRTFCWTVD